jgi:hypothetical protein
MTTGRINQVATLSSKRLAGHETSKAPAKHPASGWELNGYHLLAAYPPATRVGFG